jgi:hypothetical protein
MQKMTSLVDGKGAPTAGTSEGSMSLDPSAFVDTSNWVGEMGLTSPQQQAPKRPTRPHPVKPKPSTPTPSPEIESLEQMLEPDRTGVHKNREGKPSWVLILVIMLLLGAGAAVAVVLAMK